MPAIEKTFFIVSFMQAKDATFNSYDEVIRIINTIYQ